jgi:PAS domain S-box-containing protein
VTRPPAPSRAGGSLDVELDEPFDRLTRAAAAALGARAAAVFLLAGDELCLKSGVGVPEAWSRRGGTVAAGAFCHDVVAAGGALTIADAETDERAAAYTGREYGLVAYAGVPLVSAQGDVLGSLCVVDAEPRTWSASELDLLGAFAAAATSELELRRAAGEARERLAQLEEREAKLRLFAAQMPAVAWTTDASLRLTSAHGSMLGDVSADPETLVGTSLYDLLPSEGAGTPVSIAAHLGALAGERGSYERRTGNRDFEVVVEPLRDANGAVRGTIALAVDRTAEKEAERLSRQHAVILGAAGEGILATDREGRITVVNPAAASACGYAADEMLGRQVHELIHHSRPDGSPYPAAECDMVRRLGAGDASSGEDVFWRRDGSPFPVRYTASKIAGGDSAGGLVYVFEDISERRAAAAQLEMHRDLVSHMDIGIYVLHLEDAGDPTSLRVIEANAGSERSTGVAAAEAVGRHVVDVFPGLVESGLLEVYRSIAQGAPAADIGDFEYAHEGVAGVFSIRAFPLPGRRAGISFHNVTAQRRFEEQLRQTQKMEAVGQLAGGIAHDFNNLLTAIAGYASFAVEATGDNEELRSDLEEILRSCERAERLTQQLLAFSRRQLLQPRALNLNEIVVDSQRLLRRLIGEDIAIELELDDAIGTVRADCGQLEQVLVNLALNARDAMRDGGTLRLATANVALAEQPGEQWEAQPGAYVTLTVSDTGTGMDTDTRSRMFDPFFTTKPVGEGTGLGLATVYGIVNQSGGFIDVETAPGAGATFTVFFPATAERPESPRTEQREAVAGRGQTVAIVEDEQVVAELIRRSLEQQGYRVVVFADPVEAAASHVAAAADLLLTDVVMPNMSGRMLAERLCEVNPQLKVMYVSGYTTDAVIQRGVSEDEVAFLQKPFTLRELTEKVGALLAPA